MECAICNKELDNSIFYENDKIKIMLAPQPASNAHVQIYSKEHYTILEQLPDELIDYMAQAANSMSVILFELFKAQGTNIIIQNGVPAGQKIPHFCINIISRRSDDGLNLDWDMTKATPEELDSIHQTLVENIGPAPQARITEKDLKKEVTVISDKQDKEETDSKQEDSKKKKVNYYLKSLERIP